MKFKCLRENLFNTEEIIIQQTFVLYLLYLEGFLTRVKQSKAPVRSHETPSVLVPSQYTETQSLTLVPDP